MEILLAKDMGFCWGVRRAIDIMEKAADEKGEIISLGPIVHNPQVVRELEERGVRTTDDLSAGDSLPLAITAHGVGPEVLQDGADTIMRRIAELLPERYRGIYATAQPQPLEAKGGER